jgi:hypothetical protein
MSKPVILNLMTLLWLFYLTVFVQNKEKIGLSENEVKLLQ